MSGERLGSAQGPEPLRNLGEFGAADGAASQMVWNGHKERDASDVEGGDCDGDRLPSSSLFVTGGWGAQPSARRVAVQNLDPMRLENGDDLDLVGLPHGPSVFERRYRLSANLRIVTKFSNGPLQQGSAGSACAWSQIRHIVPSVITSISLKFVLRLP